MRLSDVRDGLGVGNTEKQDLVKSNYDNKDLAVPKSLATPAAQAAPNISNRLALLALIPLNIGTCFIRASVIIDAMCTNGPSFPIGKPDLGQ